MTIPARCSRFLAAAGAACLLAVGVAAQRWDFEARDERVEDAWSLPVKGSIFEVVDDGAGGRCARLARGPGDQPIRNAMRSMDAAPQRGRLVTLRARLRAGSDARVQMWLRVDLPDMETGFFDNMQERPVTSDAWQDVEIRGYVDEGAEQIAFGVMLIEGDELWFDDVELSFTEATERQQVQAARPLAGRALQNVAAFARLLGYVRWFHPSAAARDVDWDRFAIDGMIDIERASDAEALAAALTERFAAVAPTLRVDVTGAAQQVRLAPPERADADLQCVAYVHDGVRLGPRSVYRSEVTFAPLDERGELPDPAAPLQLELPGGVTGWLPVALYAADERALPPSSAPELPWRPAHDARDRATRLAAVAWIWNVFQHFYPYFDTVDVDWSQQLLVTLADAAVAPDAHACLDVLQKMVATAQDGHGGVLLIGDRRFARPPFTVAHVEDQLVVVAVTESARDVQVGDVLVALDGRTAGEAFDELCRRQSAATDGFRHWRAAQLLLFGEPGTELVARLRNADGDERDVTFERAREAVPAPPRPEPIAELRPGVRYVDISRLTDDEFVAAVPELAEARGVVFDFRGYPRQLSPMVLFRHLLSEPAQSQRWCVPHVLLPDRLNATYPERGRWNLEPQAPQLQGRLVFVTDGRAVSYAESCLAIVQHYELGEIVGERTAGTNGNINPFVVPGGFSVTWTGMKVLRHDGGVHHGVGIEPTVACAPTIAGIRAGRDEVLERAIELVADGR